MLNTLRHSVKVGQCLWIPEKQIAISVFFIFCKLKFCLGNIDVKQEVALRSKFLHHSFFCRESIGNPVKKSSLIVPDFCKAFIFVSNMVDILFLLGIVLANYNDIFIQKQIVQLYSASANYKMFIQSRKICKSCISET